MSKEKTEYKNIDKIGFSIRIDRDVSNLLSEYGKECIRHDIQPRSEVRYTLESAGICFPLSEESGDMIVGKWIRLIERKKKEQEDDHHVIFDEDSSEGTCW
jgi:hypothetical protein